MTSNDWPARDEWIARAEHDIRTQMFPSQRVSGQAIDYMTGAEAEDLARDLRDTRTAMSKAIKALESERAQIFDLARLAHCLQSGARALREIEQRRNHAAERVTVEAVNAERQRRLTSNAWEQELFRRRRVEQPVKVIEVNS